jgi:hypothetical protein
MDLNPGTLRFQGLAPRETKKIVPYVTRATMKQLRHFSCMTCLLSHSFQF